MTVNVSELIKISTWSLRGSTGVATVQRLGKAAGLPSLSIFISFSSFLPFLSNIPTFLFLFPSPVLSVSYLSSVNPARALEKRCKLPGGVRRGAPVANAFWYFETRKRSSGNDFGSFWAFTG